MITEAAKCLPLADLLCQVHAEALGPRSYDSPILSFATTLCQLPQLSRIT